MNFDIESYLLGVQNGEISASPVKVYSGEIECTTDSETETLIETIDVNGDIWTNEKIVLVCIRDKDGKRNDYFYGTDTIFINPIGGGATAFTSPLLVCYRFVDDVIKIATGKYGVYASYINNNNKVRISATFNNSYSKTIDGKFSVDIYLLKYINETYPF